MYLTFDVGTTSVKTALFDREGRPRAKAIRGYALATPQADWVEADPEAYWAAVLSGFRETLQAAGVNPREVRSICGSSQGETIVFLDRQDRPVRPAMVWLDNRARAQVGSSNPGWTPKSSTGTRAARTSSRPGAC
jgi:xylulokinase